LALNVYAAFSTTVAIHPLNITITEYPEKTERDLRNGLIPKRIIWSWPVLPFTRRGWFQVKPYL